MAISVTPSEREWRILLEIVNQEFGNAPSAGLPLSLLDDLCQLIPADLLSFFGMDSKDQTEWFMPDFPRTPRMQTRRRATTISRSGPTTGTATPAVTPTAAVTCVASRRSRISTRPGSGDQVRAD
jgi:hypothetical protein